MGQAVGVRSGMDEDPLIMHIASGLNLQDADFDDAFQEGRLITLIAKREYRPEWGVPWGSFAALCIRRRLRDWNRARLKHWGRGEDLPETEGRERDPADVVALAELCRKVRDAVANLPKPARRAWEGVMAGDSQSETARRIGKSKQSVYQALSTSVGWLRHCLSGGRSAT